MFFFDPKYMIFVMLPSILLVGLATLWVRSAFAKARKIPNMQRITGAQAARRILDSQGLNYVNIESTAPIQAQQTMFGRGGYGRGAMQPAGSGSSPQLDDHYDPSAKVLRLSPGVYAGTSVAALGVAAHESGHAVQDAQGYPWMRARSAIVPAANIGTQFGFILVFVGLILQLTPLAWVGVAAFGLGTLFAVLTLP